MSFEETLDKASATVQASIAVPHYFELYEQKFGIRVFRPVKVVKVYPITTGSTLIRRRPCFQQWGSLTPPVHGKTLTFLLTRELTCSPVNSCTQKILKQPTIFKGKRVVVVSAGISAIRLLDQISKVTITIWVTRCPPVFREVPFDDIAGHNAVAMGEETVCRLHLSFPLRGCLFRRVLDVKRRGVLNRFPMFSEITGNGVK